MAERYIGAANRKRVPKPHHSTMPAKKLSRNDENDPFIVYLDPKNPVKSGRRKAVKLSDQEWEWIRRLREENVKKRDQERRHLEEREARLAKIWEVMKSGQQKLSLFQFLEDIFTTNNPSRSAQLNWVLVSHGRTILEWISERRPGLVEEYYLARSGQQENGVASGAEAHISMTGYNESVMYNS